MSSKPKFPIRMAQRKAPGTPQSRPAPALLRDAAPCQAGPFRTRRQGSGPEVEWGAARSSPGWWPVGQLRRRGTSPLWAPDGTRTGSRAGVLLQAWRAARHEPRLRAPYSTEPAGPVPSRPAPPPPPPAWPGLAVPDPRSAPRRDDYDKKVKQAAKEKAKRRHTPAPTRPRKPDLQVYLPRHRGEAARPAGLLNPSRPSAPGTPLSLWGKPLLIPQGSVHLIPSRNLHLDAPRRTGMAPGPQISSYLFTDIITEDTWEPAKTYLPSCPPHHILVSSQWNREKT